jgi:hypothetical protein
VTIPRQPGGTWDVHRNTSQVFQVGPDCLPAALAALARFQRTEPRHYSWIISGYPNLTEPEHQRWFGAPYARAKAKR